jgi:ribonuclease P protein subunit RPR2
MVRIARERIADLFALAERESARRDSRLPNRYVQLARKVGTRYNVRLPAEYRELYCRGCSTFWVEGRTVRTRLRGSRRVRTYLACGRQRRVPIRRTSKSRPEAVETESPVPRDGEVLADPTPAADDDLAETDGSEDE